MMTMATINIDDGDDNASNKWWRANNYSKEMTTVAMKQWQQ